MPAKSHTRSLAALATAHIREAITSGRLALGEALSEETLAAEMGMSRTPIREALASLQTQGLITIQPQRGSYVFLPDEADIQALCEFRAVAECHALWLAHARDRDGTLERLRTAQDRMAVAHAVGDRTGSAAADAAFHDALLQGAGNPFLAQAYDIIGGRISAVRTMLLNPGETFSVSSAEHEEIIAAFAGADLLQAEATLSLHIMKMRVRFSDTMTKLGLDRLQPEKRRRPRSGGAGGR